MGPTDVLKMAEKSKILATVHAQYMNSSLCLQLRNLIRDMTSSPETHGTIFIATAHQN